MNKGVITKFKNWILENSTLKVHNSTSTSSIYLINDSISIGISDHIQIIKILDSILIYLFQKIVISI